MSLNINRIKNAVSALLEDEKSGHSDEHTFRVYDLAMKLCSAEQADSEIVALAALLHDCDDYKLFGSKCADNLTHAKQIMNEAAIACDKQTAVIDIIQHMGYSKLLSGVRPSSTEGKIVSDADMLDAIGARGILRCYAYGVHKNRPDFDKNCWPELNLSAAEYKNPNRPSDTFINHFFEKLLLLKNLMLTEAGQKEADRRHELMVTFLQHFFEEQNAPEWNLYLDRFLKDKSNGGVF